MQKMRYDGQSELSKKFVKAIFPHLSVRDSYRGRQYAAKLKRMWLEGGKLKGEYDGSCADFERVRQYDVIKIAGYDASYFPEIEWLPGPLQFPYWHELKPHCGCWAFNDVEHPCHHVTALFVRFALELDKRPCLIDIWKNAGKEAVQIF